MDTWDHSLTADCKKQGVSATSVMGYETKKKFPFSLFRFKYHRLWFYPLRDSAVEFMRRDNGRASLNSGQYIIYNLDVIKSNLKLWTFLVILKFQCVIGS
jgi:hypothetical protein